MSEELDPFVHNLNNPMSYQVVIGDTMYLPGGFSMECTSAHGIVKLGY